MADTEIKDQTNEVEELVSDEEYQKALEALNSSKSKRVKKIKEAKNTGKPKAEDTDTTSFFGKIRHDPLIMVCIILAVVFVFGAAIYFILPYARNHSLGVTYDEFYEQYKQTDIYVNLLSKIGTTFQQPEYFTPDDGAKSDLDYFTTLVDSGYGTSIIGSSRKVDGEIVAIRAYAQYGNGTENFTFLTYYFASFFQTIYPGLTTDEAVTLSNGALSTFDTSGLFIIRGEYAYRVIYDQSDDGTPFFGLDIVHASTLKDDQIKTA
ncbi:MAG: hypothetical protein K5745_06545 [Saccharofermentans sp.]|nr:hypothetical protein [Saccharofermentans sp.]